LLETAADADADAASSDTRRTTMTRMQPTTIDTAPEATKPLLAALRENLGMTPNLFATIGHSPAALGMILTAMDTLGKGALPAREIEQVNLFTSELNGCGYCVSAHAGLGRRVGLTPDDITAARAGRGANAREQASLDLVRRVVRTGGVGAGLELKTAREAGLSDGEIVEVLAHVALKAFTNAVALVAQTEIDFPKQARLPES
jgi:uncharacterized peroxidase-related enzyme